MTANVTIATDDGSSNNNEHVTLFFIWSLQKFAHTSNFWVGNQSVTRASLFFQALYFDIWLINKGPK